MNNEEKASKIAKQHKLNYTVRYNGITHTDSSEAECYNSAMDMAQWKDEQYKTAYVITRCEEHDDYVEQVFFNKIKAEEYCKSFNEDENSYHRDITEIEVSL